MSAPDHAAAPAVGGGPALAAACGAHAAASAASASADTARTARSERLGARHRGAALVPRGSQVSRPQSVSTRRTPPLRLLEPSTQDGRDGCDAPVAVERGEHGAGRDDPLAGPGMRDDIVEREGAGPDLGEGRLDPDEVIVSSGRVASHRHVHDCEGHAVALELRVRRARGPDVLGAADFAPDQVVGVIHDSHLIGFRVADTQFSDMRPVAHGAGK